MKNKKLLKYFTEQILPILDEIEFNDTEHEEYIKAQETLNQVLNKYKLKFNSNAIATGEINMKTNNVKTISLEHITYIKQVIIKEKEYLELILQEYLASNIETTDKKHRMLVHELELIILDKTKLIHSLELSRIILSKEDQQSILTSLLKLDDELFMANIGGNLKSNDYYVKLREVIDYYYKIIK